MHQFKTLSFLLCRVVCCVCVFICVFQFALSEHTLANMEKSIALADNRGVCTYVATGRSIPHTHIVLYISSYILIYIHSAQHSYPHILLSSYIHSFMSYTHTYKHSCIHMQSTGPQLYSYNKIYECHTCCKSKTVGCCKACAFTCHKGWEASYTHILICSIHISYTHILMYSYNHTLTHSYFHIIISHILIYYTLIHSYTQRS